MQIEAPFDVSIIKKYPEQVVIVLVKEDTGRINPVTIGWTMLTSHVPPMMAFSLAHSRYSLELVRKAKEFVIAYPSELQANDALLFGTRSGSDTNKLELSGISTVPSKVVDCVLLDDAVANFECRMVGEMTTGDHVIIAGEVVASHINPDSTGRLYTFAKGYKMSGILVKHN